MFRVDRKYIVKHEFSMPRYITGVDRIKRYKIGDIITITDKDQTYFYFDNDYRMRRGDCIYYFEKKTKK